MIDRAYMVENNLGHKAAEHIRILELNQIVCVRRMYTMAESPYKIIAIDKDAGTITLSTQHKL